MVIFYFKAYTTSGRELTHWTLGSSGSSWQVTFMSQLEARVTLTLSGYINASDNKTLAMLR